MTTENDKLNILLKWAEEQRDWAIKEAEQWVSDAIVHREEMAKITAYLKMINKIKELQQP